MKTLSKIIVVLLIFITCMPVCQGVAVEDAEYKYGFVQRVAESSSWGTTKVSVLIGEKGYVVSQETVIVNGTPFYEISAGDIPQQTFVKYALNEENKICFLEYTQKYTEYTDVTYNAANGVFSCAEKKMALAYIGEKGTLFEDEIPLSEGYLYSMRVYKGYGALITDFVSKTKNYTVDYISTYQSMSSDLSQREISIETLVSNKTVESPDFSGYMHFELYNSEDEIIQHQQVFVTPGDSWIAGVDICIPNRNAECVMHIWAEDENGNKITDTVVQKVIVTKGKTEAGIVQVTDISVSFGVAKATFLINDKIYVTDEKNCIVNGKKATTESDYAVISEGDVVEFYADKEYGTIKILNVRKDAFTVTEQIKNESATSFVVKGYNLPQESAVIFAEYKGEKMISVQIGKFTDGEKTFVLENASDRVLVFVWDINGLVPVTSSENIAFFE